MKIKNKKGQIDGIIAFVIIAVIILLIAPFIMKVVLEPVDKITTAYSNIGGANKSVTATGFIRDKFTGMFDWVVAAVFVFSIALLLITSFLVDIHPAFIIIYIIAAFCILSFAPSILSMMESIYDNTQFTHLTGTTQDITQYLPITRFFYENFAIILVAVFAISAIIMYGKYRAGGGGQPTGSNY